MKQTYFTIGCILVLIGGNVLDHAMIGSGVAAISIGAVLIVASTLIQA